MLASDCPKITSNSNPSININNTSPAPVQPQKEYEPLIVGNANATIRYLGFLTVLLLIAGLGIGYILGKQGEKIAFLEDIVINGYYGVTTDAARK